jgi:glycosyltransferase involved in cell wall biosynthesis
LTRVSVVTPTFNSERWIRACIGSVKMQVASGLEVEHVISDGGSTDRTVEIAEAEGCVIASRGKDRGIFDAVNKGTEFSTGQLVGFLGSDDVLLPGALDAIVRRYVSSGRRWVTGSYRWADEHFRPLGDIAAPPEWLSVEMMGALDWCYHLHMATYVERSLYDEIGGFDVDYPVSADHKFFADAMRLAPFAREPQVLAIFRRHGENFSMIGPDHAREAKLIHDEYGTRAKWQRPLVRFAMQAWVNARNPHWSYRKLKPLAVVADQAPHLVQPPKEA